jgi:hypothetical protein
MTHVLKMMLDLWLSILNTLLVLQEPFIFPSQATRVLFSNDKRQLVGKYYYQRKVDHVNLLEM